MKADAAHVVPLTQDAIKILEGLPRFKHGDHLFSTTFGEKPVNGFSKAKARLDELILKEARALAERRGDDPAKAKLHEWRIHDIRRTMRTGLSALPVSDMVRELVIAHTRPGLHKVYDQYAYLDEKRHALELWAARLRNIVDPPAGNWLSSVSRGHEVTRPKRGAKDGAPADRWGRVARDAREFFEQLGSAADYALSDPELTALDLQLVKTSKADIDIWGEQLLIMLDYFRREGHAAQAEFAMECLCGLLRAALVIGGRAGIPSRIFDSKIVERHMKRKHAAAMRTKLVFGPRAMAIERAIEAEVEQSGPIKAKAHRVNVRLKAAGQEGVSERTVRRHLTARKKGHP